MAKAGPTVIATSIDVDLGVFMKMMMPPQRYQLIVIATHQWADKAPREMMMMWVLGSLDRRQDVVQRHPHVTRAGSFPSQKKQVTEDLGKSVCSNSI